MTRKLLLFLLCLVLSLKLASAAVLITHYKFTIDVEEETLTQEVQIISNQQPGVFYSQLTSDYIRGEVLDWKQTGGKKCNDLQAVQETIDSVDYTYILCTYDDNEFLAGDYLQLQIVSTCNCTYKSGIHLFVYPSDHLFYSDSTGSIEEVVHVPEGYSLYNSSIAAASLYEATEGAVILFKEYLDQDQSLYTKYGPLFFDLEKSVDFSQMKQGNEGIFTLLYPSGFEDEAQTLLDDMSTLLPVFEKYAGGETTYDDITINLVANESVLDGYCGRAMAAPAYSNNKDVINLSISCASGNSIFHELCHLAEKPFSYPPWFSEGQAENCGAIKLMTVLGRDPEVKLTDEYRINSSKLPVSLLLGEWVRATKTNDSDNLTTKGYGLSYRLFKEILPHIDMSKFYTKVRIDFKGYQYPLPNDAVICKMNEVATADLIPIFEKYGFTIECSDKTYYFLEGPIYVYRFGNLTEVKDDEIWLVKEGTLSQLGSDELYALKKGNVSGVEDASLLWLKEGNLSLLGAHETYLYKGQNGTQLVPSNVLKDAELLELHPGDSVEEGIVLLLKNGKLSIVPKEAVTTAFQEGNVYLLKEKEIELFVWIITYFIVFVIFIVIPSGVIYLIWRLLKKRNKKK